MFISWLWYCTINYARCYYGERLSDGYMASLWYFVHQFSLVQMLSCVQLFAHQAPPSMGFSRQEYWSGLPFPSPRDLPNPGIKPMSPTLQADALTSEPPGKPYHITYARDSKKDEARKSNVQHCFPGAGRGRPGMFPEGPQCSHPGTWWVQNCSPTGTSCLEPPFQPVLEPGCWP